MNASTVESGYRRFLLILPIFIFIGTIVELWLQDHDQEPLQYIPFILCGVGLAAVLAALRFPNRRVLLALRVIMVIVALGSLLGVTLHLRGNFAFQLDIRPNASPGDVVMEALKGQDPLTAPGVLAIAAVLALAATYKHPALRRSSSKTA